MRCYEFAERGELLRQKVEEFHKVRARVREIIEINEEFKNAINRQTYDDRFNVNNVSEEGSY